MEKGKITVSCLAALLVMCLCVGTSLAGTIEIKEMQFSFTDLPYYSNQTLGFSQGTSLNADVAIPTGPSTVDYAYRIEDAVVTLSDMALSAGYGTTSGTFGGPATLSVTGTLVKKAGEVALTGNELLFEATMDSASLVMAEVFSQFASGAALFTTTGGALLAGVTDGADTLILEDFGMGLWGSGVNVLFADNAMRPYNAGVQITTDAVPEPATLGLLSLGMLALSRRRKNT